MLLRSTHWLKIATILVAICYLPLSWSQQDEELRDIREQIKQKQAQIEKQLVEAKRLQDQLKASELNIASTAQALDKTTKGINANVRQLATLTEQQKTLQQQIKQQQQALANELKTMYMAGDHDFAKMIFNMDDASKMERTFSYYGYLTEARKRQIERFKALTQQLSDVTAELKDKQITLLALEKTQRQQQTQLKQQQNIRQTTLVAIEREIDSEAAQIEQLQINEQSLVKAFEEAQRLAEQRPVDLSGLLQLKGQLLVPTQGRFRNMFGRIRQGQIRWKGVLFNGNTGSPVRAVHDGKVLYADWLRGFGLVTVVDHGEGYMSLYGHNQALLKQIGDEVQSGETIALVGQSGGQRAPNLYFEIRHKGTPVNPSQWLKL